MMVSVTNKRPNLWQYITYSYGRRLPDTMLEWVEQDNIGRGAALRLVVRVTIPCLMVVLPLLLFPNMSLEMQLTMTLPLILPFIYFSIALNRVYRRHRMTQHGLDPTLVDEAANARDYSEHQRYRERHGHQ